MNYVMAILTQFNTGNEEVVLKARGSAINKAVDVAEITRNDFIESAEIEDILTDTEEVENRESPGTTNVSSIEITLTNEG